MHHPLLSVLGGSDSSDDLSEEREDRAHRYSTDRRQHRHRHSGECENKFALSCVIEIFFLFYYWMQSTEIDNI